MHPLSGLYTQDWREALLLAGGGEGILALVYKYTQDLMPGRVLQGVAMFHKEDKYLCRTYARAHTLERTDFCDLRRTFASVKYGSEESKIKVSLKRLSLNHYIISLESGVDLAQWQ